MMTLTRTAESVAKPCGRLTQKNCATLIKRIAAGDEAAFVQLSDRTSGLLFGLLLRILGHSTTAQEVLEQVYAEIWKQADRFDEEREQALAWLIAVTYRQAIARLSEVTDERFRAVRHRLADDFNSEHGRLVRSAVNALSTGQREILELTYFSGMKESEIADYLGQPLETVRLSLNLAMQKLSALFSFLDLPPQPTIKPRSEKLK